nr:DUF3562 domain-containing protein [Paraburkholderia elongata]
MPGDRPIQLASQPSPSCNGIFVVCSSYICRSSESSVAQPNAAEVVQAIAAATNTPAETASKMYVDTVASRRRASSPGHRCRTC